MNAKLLSIIAIVLWLATIAVAATFFVRGNTAQGTDGRTAVVLSASERDLVLGEMRGLLTTVHDVLEGLNKNDMEQVAAAATRSGMGSAADVNPALMAKLPLAFKSLGMSVHHDMDALAAAAKQGKSAAELQTMLTETMGKCLGCHASWQLQTAN